MASIFTYQEEPPRVHSPWSTPRTSTPLPLEKSGLDRNSKSISTEVTAYRVTKLEAEKQDGPTEYKLHLLLRPRRKFFSASTTPPAGGSVQSRVASVTTKPLLDVPVMRPSYQPSNHTRQSRLQQLTTQLLWRLQQSSPFHSSSNADLILPVLPEATPKLGVPERPAKLLPGLEESQGALYEIGVADDGTLVGLIEDELEESLTNLKAMAASLGCVVDLLRKVAVGHCEWSEPESLTGEIRAHIGQLWVCEVLVRPESKSNKSVPDLSTSDDVNDKSQTCASAEPALVQRSDTEQLRVAITGSTTSGKSSLVGTLSTSRLDNGRGKSRLSLLKHRHEIASGVTSSVAQELIGYASNADGTFRVINYASGDVSSWPDIHNLASRLVFVSDSPGLPKFAKSTLRTLVSWAPQWTVFCVAANDDEQVVETSNTAASSPTLGDQVHTAEVGDLTLAHLNVCLRLKIPMIITVTKMDIATKTGLRTTLSKILSALKAADRIPMMLSAPPKPIPLSNVDFVDTIMDLQLISSAERSEIQKLLSKLDAEENYKIVPIVMTSSVTGSGIGKLHALLECLPSDTTFKGTDPPWYPSLGSHPISPLFHVDEVFRIPPSRVYQSTQQISGARQGVVLCGHLAGGRMSVGDNLVLGPITLDLESSDNDSPQPQSRSYTPVGDRQLTRRSLSGQFAKSLQLDSPAKQTLSQTQAVYLPVQVVSLRNLRLPVRSLEAGETGTIGVEAIESEIYQSTTTTVLQRIRKGLILASSHDDLVAYRSFVVAFSTKDFNAQYNAPPPLILGGHALIYVNSVRAAVKVISLTLAEAKMCDSGDIDQADSNSADSSFESSPVQDVFSFDDDYYHDAPNPHGTNNKNSNQHKAQKEEEQQHGAGLDSIQVTFRFVSSIEWLSVGDRVLVVPTLSAAGPVAGPVGSSAVNGLAGFVGRVNEVFT